MAKLLLMSCFLAMVVLPIRAARIPHPGRSMRRAVTSLFLFNVFYWGAVLFGYFHFVLGENPAHLLTYVRQ
jgi:hypothetical protein